jgi:protein-tyrosine phosphatase
MRLFFLPVGRKLRGCAKKHKGRREMTKPYRIMFVCLGNICRSPMAELLLKDMIKKEGREEDFIIESSATAHDNVVNGVGAPVYYHIRTLLESKGISCEGKRAQVLKKEHGDLFDLFLCTEA